MDRVQMQNGTIYEQGFGIIAKKIMRDKNLSIEAKAIYAYLCSYAGNGITAYPGEELICSDLNISRNRYYKYLRQLKDNGSININKEKSSGKYLRNVYKIVISPCTQIEDMENRHINKNSLNINNNVIKSKIHKKGKKPTNKQLEAAAELARIEAANGKTGDSICL